ncbi:hypothetical protein CC80DRAFT_246523 [Byssothecium circinans]|uniref:Uncharacterized protein n=1 Tax=Byssothecium circinans TaxID=147558 RepID=A0A6A5TBP9_9PLEO|nr:hypothetical protein CC80DRAFT_246523 [Byssothecium circinans]
MHMPTPNVMGDPNAISNVTSGANDGETSASKALSPGTSDFSNLNFDAMDGVTNYVSNPGASVSITPSSGPLNGSPSSGTLTAPTPPAPSTSSEQSSSQAKLESKCILALANMAMTLERYLLDELTVHDLIISTSRSYTQEIRKIIQCQKELRSERCMLMFITVLYQIIKLLDTGSRDVFQTEADKKRDVPDGSVDFGPKFGFGALSAFDVEEQRSWKVHVVCKECKNIEEIVGQLVALASLGPKESPLLAPSEMAERGKCVVGLQRRLKEFSDRAHSSV